MSNSIGNIIGSISNSIGGPGGQVFSGIANTITAPMQIGSVVFTGLLGTITNIGNGLTNASSNVSSLLSSSSIDIIILGIGAILIIKMMKNK
jgi:hypothetical protein